MTNYSGWLYSALTPELGQGDHHREEGRLDDVESIEPFGVLFCQDLCQRPLHVRGEALLAGLDLGGEGRRRIEQLYGHALGLGALAGEEEDGLVCGAGSAAGDARGLFALGEGSERGEQLLSVRSEDNRPVLEGRAGGGEGVGDVGWVELWVLGQVGREALCGLGQGGLGFGRERQWDRANGLLGGSARALPCLPAVPHRRRLRRLLQDQVGVGAADAEGGDAGAAGVAAWLPGGLLAH